MNVKQLKNSILQWAIQGKLVPQDPNDEPASVSYTHLDVYKRQILIDAVREANPALKDADIFDVI